MIYNFFGYPLKSNIEIPELGPANKELCPVIDFIFEDGVAENLNECNWFYQWKSDYGAVTISVARSTDNYVIEFPHLARFSLFGKKNVITCRRFDLVPGNTLRHLLLDQVLPRFIYHFFDCIVLHASLVTIDRYGVAFLGETGWGKSTLAASFNLPGSEVITDDCILLNTTGKAAYVTPSYTGVRLYEDSIQKLAPNHSEGSSKMSHYSVKKRMPISQPMQKKTHLHAMFFLNDPIKDEHKQVNKVQRMHNLEVIPQLIRHGFSLDIEDRYRQERQLQQLGKLFECGIEFFKLRYERDYDELPQLQKSIRQAITENSM